MFIASLRQGLSIPTAVLLAGLILSAGPLSAQVPLANGINTQNFDSVAAGLPAGWSVVTGATVSSLGSAAAFATATTGWSTTSGSWRNSAAADNPGFTASTSAGDQTAASDRAVGIRQTGAFGDPGAALNFNFSTSGLEVIDISFSAQMLSVQTRSTTWLLQYGIGAAPAAWTTIATFSDSGVFGATTVTATGFGTALDNQASVWLRVVALATSTGSGSRDTFGVDDFTIITTSGGVVAPTISDQPDSLTVAAGDNASFSVSASGSAPLAYQWRKDGLVLTDGGNLSGATTATLSLTGVQAADEGDYDVVVSNSAGSVPSDIAILIVETPEAPAVTVPPASQTVFAGGTATFSVTATGSAPLSYQWQKDGTDLGGETATTLTLTNVQPAAAGSYTVTVTNSAGSDTSAPAVLTVIVPDLYWDLATTNFSQNWTNTALITTNDNWSSVPSVIGYLGQDITTGTGTDPQSLTGTSSSTSDVDVIANQSNPNTLSSGGVAEFSGIANPTIALQGSGTADAPHLVLHLDTRGRTTVAVSYNLRDLDGSADNAAQPVALQYRIGDTGPFTNVPEAFVADATEGPSLAGLVTPVSVVLPAAVDNQPEVQLRIMTTNAVGNDEWVGVDDILVTSVHDGVPRVFLKETDGSTQVAEAGPATDTYSLRLNTTPGSPVTIRATADAQTEVSADGVAFGPTADLVFTDTTPRSVTVRAIDDAINEAATHFSLITHAIVSSADAGYPTTQEIPSLTVQVVDNDGGTGVTRIHTIQGNGATSPLVGFQVTINGVVTGFFTGSLGGRDGFFVQEEDANADSDPATSEGIYVFAGSGSPLAATVAALSVGDAVVVTGRANEFNSLTEVDNLATITVTGTAALPAPATVTLPLPGPTYIERYEGMRITLPQTLTVTDNYDLGHFGQIVLADGRLPQPTNVAAPGAPAQAQLAANQLNQILLDDGTSRSNPDPTPFIFDDGSGATLRAGDTTTGATGVLTYQFGLYMLQPSAPPVFTRSNPRPAAPPAVGGTLRVVSGNVLNLFNGDGAGGGFPTARGASDYVEYQRQLAKTVAAILAIAPDIMGLVEVENDGFGPASSLGQLVAALNGAAPAGTTYALVDASAVSIVTDLIHSAFIYRVETVETVGGPAMLSSPYFNNVARNPLAQTFREKATGAVLTVSINHFRAKASVSTVTDGIVPNPNIDQGDGQGTNNYLRVKEAEALVQWLATDPTGSGDADFLIIGDLNAYAQEDPITLIEAAGYVNLTELFGGPTGYSYSFDGAFGHLDHALASTSLAAQVTAAAIWHVNSDEPIYYDYNTEDKSVAQQTINVGTPYRYSDHDPVIVGLNLVAAPIITTAPAAQSVTVGDSVTFSVAVTGWPAPSFQWRKDGVVIPGATGASYTIAQPTVADAGSYDVVITNSAGSVTSQPVALTVAPATAGLTIGNLVQAYTGAPRTVSVVTAPADLPVTVTYDGASTPPVYPGAYAVSATISDPNYTASANATLYVTVTARVRHAPTLNGGLDGSVQVVLPESVTFNGNAWVSGDLLVPGTPVVRLNGQPVYGGTLEGSGAAAPADHTITLNGGATLRHVVRRVDAADLPAVTPPPAPAGTRNVALNSAGQSPGDFATLRNLTLNGNAGEVAVPPGTYGVLTANGNSRLLLGVAGSSEPTVYNLQGLTLNGNSRLLLAGPVILNLADGLTLNGAMGAPGVPDWLELNLAAGGLTLNGGAVFNGFVLAPNGTVTLNGNTTLNGGIICDRLTINGNGLLNEQ